MASYYNENDPFAAAWLRELIKAGCIAAGEVDERSIIDVNAADLKGFDQHHFFAGIGGWSAALRLAKWPDDRPVWTGSCPCPPFSNAGKSTKQSDERHLWPHWARLIREYRPAKIYGEQVTGAITAGWWDDVAADLEAEGYACAAAVLPACGVGAPHRRPRLCFVGISDGEGFQGLSGHEPGTTEWQGEERPPATSGFWSDGAQLRCADGRRRLVKPGIPLLANGVHNRVGKLRGYGNAIVPQVAAEFIKATM